MRVLRLASAVIALALLVACREAPPSPSPTGSTGGENDGARPWSRASATPAASAVGSARAMPTVDPSALDEIVRAAPHERPAPTLDGGTLVGTDTGAPPSDDKESARPKDDSARPSVAVGRPVVQPVMSNPAIERAARAGLYFQLVTRCKDPEGKILPPDSIRIKFGLDADGLIDPSSVVVTAIDKRFQDAATCMRRELSTSAFRGPAGARGQAATIDATVPSVD